MSGRSGRKDSARGGMKGRNKIRPMAIGLTGGIACGKSEVGRLLAREGAAVLDTDAVARELQKPGRPVFRAIVRRFGRGILDRRGQLDRRRLAQRVFAQPKERKALERLVHPAVLAVMERWLRARRREKNPAVVIVPLLYEVGLTEPWDVVVCVTASPGRVMTRLKARGLTVAEARARLAAQMPPAEKARRADYVIRNNGSLDDLAKRVRALWKRMMREEQ